MLGGGSVLAARWDHRGSTDIDVLLPDRETLNDAGENGPLDLAAATGGTQKGQWRNRLKIELADGKLDIAAMKPQLPELEEQTKVNGRTETVLASAQILRGKFYRTDQSVTRDAFDVTVAAQAEPKALEIAVNSLDKVETRIICNNLIVSNDQMAKEARTVLKGVTDKYRIDLERLGNSAADAVLAHRYAHVQIRVADEETVIETRTNGGKPRNDPLTGDKAAAALTRSGVGAYLAANTTLRPASVIATIEQLTAAGWTGTVFDSDDTNPNDRLKATRQAAGIREPTQITDRAGPATTDNTPPRWKAKGYLEHIRGEPTWEEPHQPPGRAAGYAESRERTQEREPPARSRWNH